MPNATLFLGIDLSKLYKTVPVVRQVTKYNQDTGEPYQVEETIDELEYFGDYEINVESIVYTKMYWDLVDLEILVDEGNWYLGKTLSKLKFDSYSDSKVVDLPSYEVALAEIKEKLTKLSWQNEEVKLVLYSYYED